MADFKIWMNGKLVPQAEAVLPVNSAAVFYATNVFEGLRAYWNAADGELYAFRLAEHFARFRESMDFIDRLLPAPLQRGLVRTVELVCAATMGLLAWLVWLKADRIWAYRDTTDVLRIAYGPFVYFMFSHSSTSPSWKRGESCGWSPAM